MNSPFDHIGDSASIEACIARAEMMFDLDRFDEARDELAQALTADPAHVQSLTFLAVLELQVGNYDEALAAASAALAAEPTHEPAIFARGHALALLRRPDEAIDVAETIQERGEDSWWHQVHYALILRESRNGQTALDAAWVAVRLEPEEGRAHLCLAMVAASLRLDDLADRALQAAERCSPGIVSLLDSELGPTLLRGRPDRSVTIRTPGDDFFIGSEPVKSPQREPLPPELSRVLRTTASVGALIALVVTFVSGGDIGVAQLLAALGALAGGLVLFILARKLPAQVMTSVKDTMSTDRLFGTAVVAVVGSPILMGAFAYLGNVGFLLGSLIASMAALSLAFARSVRM